MCGLIRFWLYMEWYVGECGKKSELFFARTKIVFRFKATFKLAIMIWELGYLNNTRFVKIEKIPLLYFQTNDNLNLSCSDIEARFLWGK